MQDIFLNITGFALSTSHEMTNDMKIKSRRRSEALIIIRNSRENILSNLFISCILFDDR